MNSPTSTALIALSLIAGAAGAQSTQAVEWKVSEGGNGHWYRIDTTPRTWEDAKTSASAAHGHLLTVQSQAEALFVRQLDHSQDALWMGLFQDHSDPGFSEPAGGWKWVTGEPLSYTNWRVNTNGQPNEPNNGMGYGDEDFGLMDGSRTSWNDGGFGLLLSCVEWDADCNGDGIVDYGQIQSGQLDDDNSDGIPDTCQYTVTGVIPVSGASSGGTAITVRGTNFPENPTVLVGGSPATNVVRVSATRITAVTPASSPGMTSVTVGNWVQPNAFYYRPECGSDLDQDGEVTAADIAIVLLDFGPCYVTATSPQPDDSKPFMLQDQPAPEAPRSR